MPNLLEWIFQIVIRTAIIIAIIVIMKEILRKGGGVFRNLLETMILAVNVGCLKIKRHILAEMKEMKGERKEEETGQAAEAENGG